ncbi:MAG TPA: ANTAR domain-containing protein [Bacillota bacterium]|nr:ANTAR domain-containing protein [Bacillota bacterium]
MYGYRVVIADSDVKSAKETAALLTRAGQIVVGQAHDGMTALRLIRNTLPDLVLLDVGIQGMTALDLVNNIDGGKLLPVILTGDFHLRDELSTFNNMWIFGFLFKPVTEVNLLPTMQLAVHNFQRQNEMAKEIEELKNTLQVRKVVDKAKGILMKTAGLTEEAAFRKIQKQSMDKGKPMKVVAEAIILAHELSY